MFVPTESLAAPLHQLLAQKSFVVSWSKSAPEFTDWVISNRHRIDCLIVQSAESAFRALQTLKHRDILLPTLTVSAGEQFSEDLDANERSDVRWEDRPESRDDDNVATLSATAYHDAVTSLDVDDLEGIDEAIHQAVDCYLQLPTEAKAVEAKQADSSSDLNLLDKRDKRLFLLSLQQQRLTEKLRERLGYVGVYYKRNQRNFLRHMTTAERQEFLDKLYQDYRHIILNYFANDPVINQKIDDFVNVAFFADISVPKIVEIHMELIDDFSKQLQLEGRNEEILSDYRLTLIDVIAHLCEMYRRSIPREM